MNVKGPETLTDLSQGFKNVLLTYGLHITQNLTDKKLGYCAIIRTAMRAGKTHRQPER